MKLFKMICGLEFLSQLLAKQLNGGVIVGHRMLSKAGERNLNNKQLVQFCVFHRELGDQKGMEHPSLHLLMLHKSKLYERTILRNRKYDDLIVGSPYSKQYLSTSSSYKKRDPHPSGDKDKAATTGKKLEKATDIDDNTESKLNGNNVERESALNPASLPQSSLLKILNKKSIKRAKKLREELEDWEPVYRFRYIRYARLIQRLKLGQTAFTCLFVLPVSLGMFVWGMASFEVFLFYMGVSSFACVMLYIMGTFSSRLIGVMYSSKKDPSVVRVARLNFWGKREDQIYSKTDFVPFSELSDNLKDVYINVKFYSEPESKLHICLRYGFVYDKEEFEQIFGSYALFNIRKVDEDKERRKKTT